MSVMKGLLLSLGNEMKAKERIVARLQNHAKGPFEV